MSDGPLLALIRERVAVVRAELRKLEQVEALLTEAPMNGHAEVAPAPAAVVPARVPRGAKAKAGPRGHVAGDGGLEADVLAALRLLGRPVKTREICDRVPGVDQAQIVGALRGLVKRRQVVKSGATISLRYALPEFATPDGAE